MHCAMTIGTIRPHPQRGGDITFCSAEDQIYSLYSFPYVALSQYYRGGADRDILMKPGSECSENLVLPGFSEENQA